MPSNLQTAEKMLRRVGIPAVLVDADAMLTAIGRDWMNQSADVVYRHRDNADDVTSPLLDFAVRAAMPDRCPPGRFFAAVFFGPQETQGEANAIACHEAAHWLLWDENPVVRLSNRTEAQHALDSLADPPGVIGHGPRWCRMALHVATRCRKLGFDVPLDEVLRPWLYGLPAPADCVESLYEDLAQGRQHTLAALARRKPPASFFRLCQQTRGGKLLH